MHRGMAHFVDLPTELYHSLSWASSVRSTSGEYAHIQQDDEEETGELVPGPTIFPSDFVLYCCTNRDCVCQPAFSHIGRVVAVGKDYRSDRCTDQPGGIAFIIHEALARPDLREQGFLPDHPLAATGPIQPTLEDDELIMHCIDVSVPESYITDIVTDQVSCDYFWGELHEDPAPRRELAGTIREQANPIRRRERAAQRAHVRAKIFPKYGRLV